MMTFDKPRLNHLEHRPNADPLVPEEWEPPYGIVACYASLVKDMGKDGKGYFRRLAQRYRGRFFLHADEAQFCGVTEWGEGDAITGGALAGAYIEELHDYAFHTLLQTGTENRADGQPLVLCEEKYADPKDGELRGPLIPDAEGSYGAGRELGYLREFEVDYIDDHVTKRNLTTSERAEYELSESGKFLAQVLRKNEVWQPDCDKVIQRLRERQKIWPGYKGLICCMDQAHAGAVVEYVKRVFPSLRVTLAVSSQGEMRKHGHQGGDALANLKAFRQPGSPYDLLVTVRMAFIGYDCKEITVIGILTNYRDRGHLLQQVGRALRVLPGREYREQVCWIVAPKDPRMRAFIQWLKEEQKKGTRFKGDGPAPGTSSEYVEKAYATAVTADGLTGSVEDPLEYEEIERLRRELGIYEPVTKLKRLKDAWAHAETLFDVPDEEAAPPPPSTSEPKTGKELVVELRGIVAENSKIAAKKLGLRPDNPAYKDFLTWFHEKVAGLSYWSGDARTPERALERVKASEQILAAIQNGSLRWP